MSDIVVNVESREASAIRCPTSIARTRSRPGCAGLRTRANRATTERPEDEEFWALKDVSLAGTPGRVPRPGWQERIGQIHPAEDPFPYHSADRGTAYGFAAALPRCWKSAPAFIRNSPARENIFLNGAMLGCPGTRDTPPVRRHRGFFRRRALSRYTRQALFQRNVCALGLCGSGTRLTADMLVIDEVLAVGDAEFQEKSLRHMRQLLAQKKTCVLVSHDLDAIKKLATDVTWLDMGTVVESALDRPAVCLIDTRFRAELACPSPTSMLRVWHLCGRNQPEREKMAGLGRDQ